MWALGGVLLLAFSIHMSPAFDRPSHVVGLVENMQVDQKVEEGVNFGKLLHKPVGTEQGENHISFLQNLEEQVALNPPEESVMNQYPIFKEWEADPLAQQLLKLLAQSDKFPELKAVKLSQKKVQPGKVSSENLEEEIRKALGINKVEDDPVNTVKVHIAAQKLAGKELDPAARQEAIQKIVKGINSDKQAADEVMKRISASMEKQQDVVITDCEGDDLWNLLLRFHAGRPPKLVMTYGGYTDLEHALLERFIAILCKHYGIERENGPKVVMGFPHFQDPNKRRNLFDAVKGSGILKEEERAKLIDLAKKREDDLRPKWEKEIENEDKQENEKEKDTEWWRGEPAFEEGVKALGKLIDEQEYTSVTALACPSVLYYALKDNPTRQKKVGLACSSGYVYDMTEDGGVRFSPSFNGARKLKEFNALLEMNIDIVNLGGGLSKTKGARIMTDTSIGRDGKKYYTDEGFTHYDELVNADSPIEMFQFVAMTANAFTYAKWLDWDQDLTDFWKYLGVEAPKRPGLDKLREIPEGPVGDFLRTELAKKAKAKANSKQRVPEAVNWPADRLFNQLKTWGLAGHDMNSQVNPADLHTLILLKPNLPGVTGVIRVKATPAPAIPDRQTGKPRAALDNLEVVTDGGNFAVTDLNFEFIRNQVQTCLTAHKRMQNRESIDDLFKDPNSTPPVYLEYMRNHPGHSGDTVHSGHTAHSGDTDMS